GLLVLDEASSRLDPVSDRLIERALDKLLGGEGGRPRTAIIIAHKLSTVARADRICILERGRVLEAAERAALVADPNSAFSKLWAPGVGGALACAWSRASIPPKPRRCRRRRRRSAPSARRGASRCSGPGSSRSA